MAELDSLNKDEHVEDTRNCVDSCYRGVYEDHANAGRLRGEKMRKGI